MIDLIQAPVSPAPPAPPTPGQIEPPPLLSASTYELRISVTDAASNAITDPAQAVAVLIGETRINATFDGTRYRAQIPRGALPKVTFVVNNPKFFDFAATFEVSIGRTGLELWRRTEGGMASAVTFDGQFVVDAFVLLSRLKRVDDGSGSKIRKEEGPNWFHTQLDDMGPFVKGFEFPLLEPKDPVVSSDTNSTGPRRLLYDLQTPVRPIGRIYVFEYKTDTAPKLLFVWHNAAMDFSKAFPGGKTGSIGYHFYFHPWPRATEEYPYGVDRAGNQPHVDVGYRHLMFESWGSVQHFYANRRVVYVVPVGSRKDMFGEAATAGGIYRLLREINLAVHAENKADPANYLSQDVGRVAVSGFSAGAHFMVRALAQAFDPSGKEFMQNRVREIYSWDGAIGGVAGGEPIPNTVPKDFGGLNRRWWPDESQLFRVYTANASYDSELSFLQRFATRGDGPAGTYAKSYQKEGKVFGTLIVLPGGFFRRSYKTQSLGDNKFLYTLDPLQVYRGNDAGETDPGFPSYNDYEHPPIAHHWFFKVFMYHAMMHSGFEPI